MKKVALFYSFNSNKTARLGEKIVNIIGKDLVDILMPNKLLLKQFINRTYIVGVSTWFDVELPICRTIVPAIQGLI